MVAQGGRRGGDGGGNGRNLARAEGGSHDGNVFDVDVIACGPGLLHVTDLVVVADMRQGDGAGTEKSSGEDD